jgi:Protein of unknown function (DUF3577)
MNNSDNVRYFDLHTTGVGYLNRVRDVEPENGSPFLAVTVAAIHGKSTEVDHTYFECAVYGEQAQAIVRQLQPSIEADQKVFVGFTLSNLKADAFTFQQGDKAGQSGVNLKARLIRIAWAKVDGQKISFDQKQVA